MSFSFESPFCVTSGKLFNLSEGQLPLLKREDSVSYLEGHGDEWRASLSDCEM